LPLAIADLPAIHLNTRHHAGGSLNYIAPAFTSAVLPVVSQLAAFICRLALGAFLRQRKAHLKAPSPSLRRPTSRP
jgi:hypothetical protein